MILEFIEIINQATYGTMGELLIATTLMIVLSIAITRDQEEIKQIIGPVAIGIAGILPMVWPLAGIAMIVSIVSAFQPKGLISNYLTSRAIMPMIKKLPQPKIRKTLKKLAKDQKSNIGGKK